MQLYKLLGELSESARYTKILNFHKADRKQIILLKFIVQPFVVLDSFYSSQCKTILTFPSKSKGLKDEPFLAVDKNKAR